MHLLISFLVLLVLLLAGVRIAVALAAAGMVGLLVFLGPQGTYAAVGSIPYSSVAKYSLSVVPLFIVMGILAKNAGLGERAFRLVSGISGRFPAGAGLATVGAMGAFAAVSASSVASVAALGPIADSEMRRAGYTAHLRSGLIAVSGTLGVLIPPSIILVIYGITTGENIGQLLLAGVIPGILTMVAYAVVVMALAGRSVRATQPAVAAQQSAARPADFDGAAETSTPDSGGSAFTRENIIGGLQALSLFAIVMGGIFSGWFSATEAAAVGAIVALVMLLMNRSSAGQRRRLLAESFREATSSTAMIFFLIVGASIYGYYLTITRVPHELSQAVAESGYNRYIVLLLILLALLVMGLFLETMSLLLISVPLIYPVLVGSLEFDGIWLGIIVVKMIEIALITPPVGLNVYVLSGAIKLPPEVIFRGVVPFFVAELVLIGLLIAFPELVTWLPSHV